MSGPPLLGTGTLNGSGAATLSTTTLPVGTDSVTASYAAAGNFAASTSAATTITVNCVIADHHLARDRIAGLRQRALCGDGDFQLGQQLSGHHHGAVRSGNDQRRHGDHHRRGHRRAAGHPRPAIQDYGPAHDYAELPGNAGAVDRHGQ